MDMWYALISHITHTKCSIVWYASNHGINLGTDYQSRWSARLALNIARPVLIIATSRRYTRIICIAATLEIGRGGGAEAMLPELSVS